MKDPVVQGISSREPLLFTPGPLTVSGPVKQAMLVDYGSRDKLFLDAVVEVRQSLLQVAGAKAGREFLDGAAEDTEMRFPVAGQAPVKCCPPV
eukprot:s845_g2.t1